MIPNQLLIICIGKHLPTNPIVVYVSWSKLERGAVPMKRHKGAIQKKKEIATRNSNYCFI